MYRSIPVNGAAMRSLVELLEDHGLLAVLETLEVLARERAAEPRNSVWQTRHWTDAADALKEISSLNAVAWT